jgi:hypothetical protein
MKRATKKEYKTVNFMIKLTQSEKEMIERIAREKGLTQTQVIRQYYLP